MIADVGDITSFKWATVTAVTPLGIKLDGDTVTLGLVPESLIDPLELLVGDRVRVELSLRKCIIHGAANGGGQSGDVKLTARDAASRGWMLCQGQSLLRASYPRLFAAIGTTYGAADSTHFSLPDLRQRVAVGNGGSGTFNHLGQVGGEETHLLTANESGLRDHAHSLTGGDGHAFAWGGAGGSTVYLQNAIAAAGSPPSNNASTIQNNWNSTRGSGALNAATAHNNIQPYVVLNYQIKI